MELKIRVGSISKIIIELLVLMHLCYFLMVFRGTRLFADSFVPKTRMVLFFFMIGISIIASVHYLKKSSMKFLAFEMLLLVISWINGYNSVLVKGYKWDDALALLRVYIYPIVAIAVIPLLTSGIWRFEKLLKFLAVATSIDTLARAVNSFAEHFTGVFPWPNLIYGEMGYRNGIYRINPSNLDILVIPIAFYLLSKAETKSAKRWCAVGIIINYLYALVIWQARSAIVYKTIVLIVLFYTQRKLDKKKVIWLIFGVIASVIIFNFPFFNEFLDSFSTANGEYGGSTSYRLNAIAYYMSMYSKNMIWGTGLLNVDQRIATGGGALGDIGFLYSIIQLGVPIIAFYIVIFGRAIYVAIKNSYYDSGKSRLIMGITLICMLFGVNIDTFYGFALSVPFYLTIVEYTAWKGNNAAYLEIECNGTNR